MKPHAQDEWGTVQQGLQHRQEQDQQQQQQQQCIAVSCAVVQSRDEQTL